MLAAGVDQFFFFLYSCTLLEKKTFFIGYISGLFDDLVESTLLAGGKSKKDGNLGDSARGQADSGSAAVYTMDRPGTWSDMGSAVILHGLVY